MSLYFINFWLHLFACTIAWRSLKISSPDIFASVLSEEPTGRIYRLIFFQDSESYKAFKDVSCSFPFIIDQVIESSVCTLMKSTRCSARCGRITSANHILYTFYRSYPCMIKMTRSSIETEFSFSICFDILFDFNL